jgi:hypothetical protein
MLSTRVLVIAAAALTAAAAALTAQTPAQKLSPASDFLPDTTFAGSALTAFRPIGDADWKATAGEIVGTPKAGGTGGWLVLDKPYNDIYFFSRFQCAAGCKGGVLFRVTDTPDGGRTGTFVSLDPADLHVYKLTIDAQGRETSREPLPNATPFTRLAPPARGGGGGGRGAAPAGPPAPLTAAPPCTGNGAGRGGSPKHVPPSLLSLPDLQPPPSGVWPGQWNSITVSVDADTVRPWLNGGVDMCGAFVEDRDAYGPVALFAGGTGDVRYKDVSFKDIQMRVLDKEVIGSNFRMQRIEDFDYSFGAAVADVDKDGNNDIVAANWIFYGPDFTKRQEMYPLATFAPSASFPTTMVDYAYDFTGDGWPDVLAGESRAMHLYVNPQGKNTHWKQFFVLPQITSEAAVMQDLDGDGRPEIIYGEGGAGDNSTIAFAGYDPANPTAVPWTSFKVSEPGLGFGHGAGVGDINGDGKPDILQTAGWWEQPAAGIRSGPWKYHPVAFGRWGHSESAGGAELMVYDVNGDRLNDVVTGLNAHGFGLAWFEQKRAGNGDISFVRHMIMDDFSTKNAGGVTFSEMHASNMGDIDGDGIPDYVTGKRVYSHQESYVDPDPLGAAVLYVYRTVRNRNAPGGAEFVPELVHNRSGVGSQFTVTDVNKDGIQDIVTSANRGTFVFFGQRRGR